MPCASRRALALVICQVAKATWAVVARAAHGLYAAVCACGQRVKLAALVVLAFRRLGAVAHHHLAGVGSNIALLERSVAFLV